MNITSLPQAAQACHARPAVLGLLLAACAGGSQSPSAAAIPVPSDPETAVGSFMYAVNTKNLVAMGQLWGSSKGPAVTYMEKGHLEQRLTVMQVYLAHEQFEIVSGNLGTTLTAEPNTEMVYVRINRRGCAPVVPFTLIRYRDGWIINAIDLEQAGNPARSCARGG